MNNNQDNNILFSIVIPIMEVNDYLIETCQKFNSFPKKNFEILVFANEANEEYEKKLGIKIIPMGHVSPAIKRDEALKYAKGKYLAFTDDDAYPDKKWLDIAEKYLENKEVAAIGGPQITPPGDSFWQKVSGAMFVSPLSGKAVIRYWPGKKVEEIVDWPTVNFIVKKEAFERAGGFDSAYWPGEDTKLCLDIIEKLKKKILYIPELIVYHHRRSGFRRHLKQVGNYGIHRGFFAKVFPATSGKFNTFYFVPSLFALYLLAGTVVLFSSPIIQKLYLAGLAIYAAAILYSTFSLMAKTKSFWISAAAIPYLVSFHIWYGIRFIQGFFFTKKLNSKLGR